MMTQAHDIADEGLAEAGRGRIEWAAQEMPVLRLLQERFSAEQPLEGVRIGGCLHITTETAVLARTLKAGGADLALCASNPLSTQDDVAAALVVDLGVPVFARCGENRETYFRHIEAVIARRPQITADDGADLVSTIHACHPALTAEIAGGTEETTTGVMRLRTMAREGALRYPIVAVNDADTKHLFDNRYGTGQSTIDGILRATNLLLAGRTVTVAGYGWCGRGIAMRACGLGAKVIITEVEPLRALEAGMDGYEVMPMLEAATRSDVIVTATGDKNVVNEGHFAVMKDGCILANSGHFDVEVNVRRLRELAVEVSRPRAHVEEFRMPDERRIRLLAEGRLVNLAAAEGHPAAVMDMSFANQALSLVHIWANRGKLDSEVHPVPAAIDQEVARLKIEAMGVRIDKLTAIQAAYLASWREGT
jgi:adenosylhomocysteinase